MVLSSARTSYRARENRREDRLGLLRGPVRFSGGHGTHRGGLWANERRRGVPAYVSVAPLAPGGISGRLGANPKAEDGPHDGDTEVTR